MRRQTAHMLPPTRRLLWCATLWGVLAALPVAGVLAAPQRHALLVGVSDYLHVPDMEGPRHDVQALAAVLVERWGFDPASVQVLVDGAATKDAVLRGLRALFERSRPGDEVLVYLSGHGTSGQDPTASWPLPYTTGAFIPVDFDPNTAPQQQLEQLIVGRWDLRPLLEHLDDGGRHSVVVVDACFSGNAVRASNAAAKLTRRYVALPDRVAVTRGSMAAELADSVETGYPYRNVLFLAAAHEYQFAADIGAEMLAEFPTRDGQPHGAFTDALLRTLHGELPADDDGDDRLSYVEISRAVEHFMAERGYAQTPQLLPGAGALGTRLASRPAFRAETPGAPVPADGRGILRVAASGVSAELREQLAKLPEVVVVDSTPDIHVAASGIETEITAATGELLARLPGREFDALARLLRREILLRGLAERPAGGSRTVSLELVGAAPDAPLHDGDSFSFRLSVRQRGYLVLVGIDPDGTASLFYPLDSDELQPLEPGAEVWLPSADPADRLIVSPPYGRTVLIAIVDEQPPPGLRELISTGAPLDDVSLAKLLPGGPAGRGYATLTLRTVPRPGG